MLKDKDTHTPLMQDNWHNLIDTHAKHKDSAT